MTPPRDDVGSSNRGKVKPYVAGVGDPVVDLDGVSLGLTKELIRLRRDKYESQERIMLEQEKSKRLKLVLTFFTPVIGFAFGAPIFDLWPVVWSLVVVATSVILFPIVWRVCLGPKR